MDTCLTNDKPFHSSVCCPTQSTVNQRFSHSFNCCLSVFPSVLILAAPDPDVRPRQYILHISLDLRHTRHHLILKPHTAAFFKPSYSQAAHCSILQTILYLSRTLQHSSNHLILKPHTAVLFKSSCTQVAHCSIF